MKIHMRCPSCKFDKDFEGAICDDCLAARKKYLSEQNAKRKKGTLKLSDREKRLLTNVLDDFTDRFQRDPRMKLEKRFVTTLLKRLEKL